MKKSKDSAEGGSSSSRTGGGRRWGRGHEDQCVTSSTSNDGNNNDNNDKQQQRDHDQEHHFTTTTSAAAEQNVTADTVYQFYAEQLVPAILSSLPILLHRVTGDVWRAFQAITGPICNWWFAVVPRHYDNYHPPSLSDMWSAAAEGSGAPSVADFMLRHFDVNGDGHISSAELLNMTDILNRLPPMPHYYYPHAAVPESWWMWFSREWPLFEWKVGVFLWRSFGGVIFALAVLSIVPGRMHGVAGKVLRWPLLALTYLLIGVELTVYTVIRGFIRLAEYAVARPRHRRLRRRMAAAVTYGEWYAHAAALDRSQGRDHWLERCYDDKTVGRYNWGFVKELIKDMRAAREKCDSLQALAVLQQCTRKNVGGVMSEDLFSYANTGEPKAIVREFVDEVAITIHWVTDEAMKLDDNTSANANKNSNNDGGGDNNDKEHYEERLQKKVDHEKNKLWSIVMATASLLDHSNHHHHHHNKNNNNNNNNHEDGNGSDDCNSTISTSNSSASSSSAAAGLPPFHREEVVRFLKRARFAYGKTALCLSGGAMMGAYHFGHVLGLLESGILPHIISGTSAGSVVGAILCTRTDEELKRVLTPEVLVTKLICFRRPWLERLKSVVENGHLFDLDEWLELIRWFTMGDMTFEEAHRRTGRVLCITLTSTTKKSPPMLLNYLSAPNVTIASAVVASAAVPGFVPPVKLRHKDARGVVTELGGEAYFDGSIERDIPVDGLAEMLNCQFFVACQCNPHVVPFFYNCKGGVGRPSRWSSGTQEDSWRGGFLLASLELYLKNHMRAKFRFLNEVEAAVGFTSTMMTQEFVGSTTIVPQVCFTDYFKLFTNPCLEDLYWYFQAGSVAAYEHTAMIKLHYSVADALDECLDKLEKTPGRDRDHVVASSKRRPKFTIPGTKKVTTPTTAASSSPLSSSSSSQPSSSSTTATTTSLSSTAPKPDGKHEKDDDDKEQEEYFDNPYPDELKEYEKNWIRLE